MTNSRGVESLPTRYLEIDGGRLAYDDTGGDGQVVVCVPGLGDIRSAYRHLRPLLTAHGYRVVTVDLRGAGESSAGWTDYSTTAIAADILALVRHLDTGPVRLITNSYTGGTGYLVTAEAPELFAALVLTAPFARQQPDPKAFVKLATWFVSHLTSGWIAYWSSLFKTAKPDDFTEQKKALAASLRKPGHLAALREMLAAGQAPGEAAAAKVNCPVLVVMGTVDPDFPDPATEAKAVAGLVRNGTVVLVDGCGHYPATEFPQATADAIIPFLEAASR